MAFKAGDRVRIVMTDGKRVVPKETGKSKDKDLFSLPLVYPYMNGMVGKVANVYSPEEVTVEVDLSCLPPVIADVHQKSTERIRAKLFDGPNSLSEEARKKLTDDELNFTPHFVLLLSEDDLQKA